MRKPWIAASGAPTRGSLALLARSRLRGGQADHMQGEAPRRDESLRALVDEIALDEGVGHEALQVVGRLPLHAGGDFFAEEFEEKIGHEGRLKVAFLRLALNPRGRGGATPSPSGRRWPEGPDEGYPPAPPPAVLSHAAPQALASSRTLRI